jgi:hypothetical protein
MIDDECRLFLEELNEIEMMATSADHQEIQRVLQRWFYTIDRSPDPILALVSELIETTTLQSVNDNMVRIQNGIGNNQFVWPLDRQERLGGQHIFLRDASEDDFDFSKFLFSFYYEQHGNLNDASYQFVLRFFSTYIRELTRYLEMRLNGDPVPASDRVVSVNHNSPKFKEIESSLAEVKKQVAESNSLEDSERIQAELAAGEKILEPDTVRVSAVRLLLINPLSHIGKIVRDTALGQLALKVLGLIATYFGISF